MVDKKIISIVGGSGFIGKYLVNNLTKHDYYINVISRNPNSFKKNQVQQKLGQISIKSTDIKDKNGLTKATEGSDYIINLTGLLLDKKKNSFKDVHVEGAKNIVYAAQKNNIKKIVHISAIGASKNSFANYALTKYQAEHNIKKFKDYLIIRPSIVYGDEDKFINLFAKLAQISPFLPLVGGGKTKFQPIWVEDLANIIIKLLENKIVKNKIIEVGGNQIVSFEEIIKLILKEIGLNRYLLKLPFSYSKKIAFFIEKMPKAILTRDQVEMLKQDNTVSKKYDYKSLIKYEPQDFKEMLSKQLILFKKGGGHFS